MSIEIPYPQREKHILKDGFNHLLQAAGQTLLQYSPVYTDPFVLKQRWLVTPNGKEYDEQAFYTSFNENIFRRALRFLVANSAYAQDHSSFLSLTPTQRTFLEEQEFLLPRLSRKSGSLASFDLTKIHLLRGPACQHISNIGHTLEWFVAEWFRREYHALARHGVKTQELRAGGDLDVVAFKDDLRIMVECKSSSHIPTQKLHLFSQRASDFQADITLLLIDTENSDPVDMRTRELCTLLQLPYEPKRKQLHGKTLYRWIPNHNIYITNTGAGIATTLTNILHFHHARIQLLLP